MAADWTTGAAKWAAVFLLGGVSATGLWWSIYGRPYTAPVVITRAPQPAPPEPAPVEPVAQRTAPEPASTPIMAAPQEEPPLEPEPAPPPALTRTININTAGSAELELLPGIGPALAGRIIEHRRAIGRFTSIEQLDDVKGIGPATLAKLRPLIRVE